MDIIVAYDIAHPRRLNRVAKIMKDYGVRVQKSVFELDVDSRRFSEMRGRIESELEPSEDGVKYFPLCKSCREVFYAAGRDSAPDAREGCVIL
jgi:CRISPR-associated protein Cas2